MNEGKVIKLAPDLFTHTVSASAVKKILLETIGNYHTQNPDSPGIPPADLLEKTRLQKTLFDGITSLMLTENSIITKKERFASPAHKENFDDTQIKLNNKIESLFLSQLFNPPKFDEIVAKIKTSEKDLQNTLRILTEQQKLIYVDKDMLFHSNAIEEAKKRLTDHIQKEGLLESVKFKYLLDTTRKFAIPLLDYMDKIGVTTRAGHTRYLKKQ